ncbi:MAG: hypothetical protein H0T52_04405 [Lautropia sp.]|nr:hypothetical protein [Lautropia sp.]
MTRWLAAIAIAAAVAVAVPAASAIAEPLKLAQNLESTIIPDPSRVQGYSLGYPRRKPGLWEIRNASGDSLGMPPTSYCVGDRTDMQENHLDRVAGEKGSCTIGPFKLVGISWVAESVCKESRSVVVSQSIASGDFQTQYRIDTLVFYSPPLANNKREDRESVVARYLGPCGPGQRPGDLVVPGMGVLNMGDGTLKQAPKR